MTHAEIKDKMIWAGKVLVNEGQDDFTRGHISFRLPDNPKLFFMKCHSIGLDEITPENILTIDLEGNVVAGTRAGTARSISIPRSSRCGRTCTASCTRIRFTRSCGRAAGGR